MNTDTMFAALGEQFHRWRSRRRRAHSARVIEALPAHIRKDIGWKDNAIARGQSLREPWSSF